MSARPERALPALIAALLVAGCVLDKGAAPDGSLELLESAASQDPSRDSLAKAQKHFRNEDYGLAETHFREAVERNPRNSDAWLGLAASYDRLRRFDLAERAYNVVIRQVGYTLSVHNNLGYHHYLRDDPDKARKHFEAALRMDPGNPQLLRNMELLDES